MAGRRRETLERAGGVGSFVVLACLVVAGCGGDGVLEVVAPPEPPPPQGSTLSEIQAAVFTPRCALPGCHGAPAPVLGLDLTEGRSHGSLVGVPSAELPSFQRVEPGDPVDSYLYMKLLGDPRIAGDRMPLLGPPLEASDLERIRTWIEAGAPDN